MTIPKLALILAAGSSLLILSACNSSKIEAVSPQNTAAAIDTHKVVVTRVVLQCPSRELRLPADLLAYRDVAIYSKVSGFVEWIGVDRGSSVKKGAPLIKMTAPELSAQSQEGVNAADSAQDQKREAGEERAVVEQQLVAAEAKSKASTDTYQRLKEASAYPGIIAGNDLEVAQKTAEANLAYVHSLEKKCKALKSQELSAQNKQQAARQSAKSTKSIESYLNLNAPFDGVISERNVHEGSFVHPPAADTTALPLLRLKQLSVLRLVVPVPEVDVAGVVPGAVVQFTVSAFPGEPFTAVVRRIADSVDLATRTMAVELDVDNPQHRLRPGMFAEVSWPVRREKATLFVPQTAVVKTTERIFVIRIKSGVAEWVDVKPGFSADDTVEVFGNLQEGDEVAVRGTDELRNGSTVSIEERPAAKTTVPGSKDQATILK